MTETNFQASFSSLVPRRLLAWPDGTPYRDCHGAILFADIAGFTRLTENSRRRSGHRGIESLTAAINALFGDLIEAISSFDGDVLKFGGDALLVAFDDGAGEPSSTSRAVQCAEQFYRVVNHHRRAGLRGLSLHVGIATGRWSEHVVGDGASRCEHFVHGPAITNAMAVAEASIDRAHIRCPARLLPSKLPVEYHRIGSAHFEITARTRIARVAAALPTDAPPSATAWRFVPVALKAWIAAHASNFAAGAEHRRVSSLFVFWKQNGRSNRSEDQEQFSAILGAVEHALAGTRGLWARSDPAGRRQKILILFGALQSCDDDAAQAVECALRLRESLHALARDHRGFRAGIGVATATVFTGFVGNNRRREFTVMGDGINLAARLAAKAPPGVVQVDEATRLAARGYTFDSLGSLLFKNIRRPIPVYRLESRSDVGALNLDDAVIEHPQALKQALERLENGSGQVVEIAAAPDADTRKFVHDLARSLHLPSLRAREVMFFESDGALPLGGLARFLNKLCGIPSLAALGEIIAMPGPSEAGLRRALCGDASALANLTRLSGVEGLAILLAGNPLVRAALQRLPREIAMVASGGFETLSPLDQSVLRRLMESQSTNCHWIVLHTTEKLENAPRGAIQLGPLTTSEFRGVLGDLLAPAIASPQLVEFLFQRSEGKARLARLYLAHLIAHGFVHTSGSPAIVKLGDTAGLDLPDDLRSNFLQRIDQLTPSMQAPLRALSIFSGRVSIEIVRRLIEPTLTESDWNDSLRGLIAEKLVVLSDEGVSRTIAFGDPVCRQAVYETMSYSLREHWHKAAAEYFHQLRDFSPAAEHFFRARDRRAFPLLRREAQRARRLWLLERARLYLRWAILASENRCDPEFKRTTPSIPLFPTATQRLLFIELADVLRSQGHHLECARIHRRLARLAQRTHNRREQAEHRLIVARCAWYEGRYGWSAGEAKRAHALALRTRDRELVAQSAFLMGENYRRTGRVRSAGDAYAAALHHTDPRRQSFEYADIQNGLGLLHWNCGRLDQAEACFRAALRSLGRRTDPSRRGQIANNLGLITEEQGRLRVAERYYQKAFEVFDRYGMRRRRAYSLGNLANLHRHAARYESARSTYEEVELELRAIGEPHPAFYTVGNLGDLARDFGDFTTARRNYETTLTFAERSGDAELKAECHARLAMLCLLEQRPRAIPRHLRAAHRAAAIAKSCEFSLHASLVAAEYSLHEGKSASALQQFEHARARADGARLHYYQLWAAFGVAKALAACSEHDAALRLARRTAATAGCAGYRWWQFHALVLATRLARHLIKPAYSRLLMEAFALRKEIEAGIGDIQIKRSFALLPVIRRLESNGTEFTLDEPVTHT
jgi:class 3 adenylate cyclase/tetratricopeptide (TPR) repeat protein